MKHQMKLIKVNKQLAAKGKWYEWKQKWIENLYEMADKGFAELQAVSRIVYSFVFSTESTYQDEKALNQIIRDAEDLLPALREQHAQILGQDHRVGFLKEGMERLYLVLWVMLINNCQDMTPVSIINTSHTLVSHAP